jgi:zinc transport system substrate-binding protein
MIVIGAESCGMPPVRARLGTVAAPAAALLAAALLAAALLAAAGCGAAPRGGDGRVRVVVAFYPLQFVAESIGGSLVRVTNLVAPGAEPHDLELRPRQLAELGSADLVLYLRGFQPAVDEAVDREVTDKAFDVSTVEPLAAAAADGADPHAATRQPGAGDEEPTGGKDPHVWLDPLRLATIVDRVAERLTGSDPPAADAFTSRAAALRAELTELDRQYADGLARCARRDIVTSHAAFGYLARRYGLRQVPITGLTPEEEPTPQRLARVAELARRDGVTTIFFESLVSPKVAETLAREVGARAQVLDPIEGIQPGTGADYLSVMRANLDKLRSALECQ